MAVTFYRSDAVFDGVTGLTRAAVGLLVDGAHVVSVLKESDLPGGWSVDIVDLGGGVILPGFIDSHTHVTIRPGEGDQHGQLVMPPVWQAIRGVRNMGEMLRSGVTTARIMTEEAGIDLEFRDAVARGEVAGPRLLVSGPGMSPPGGHGSAAGGVAGVDDLRAGVRARAASGVDHIKIFTTGGVSSPGTSLEVSQYSADEIAAIVDEAANAGLKVSAHAHGGPGVSLAVQNGIHSIEHGTLLDEENLVLMSAANTWLTLTTTILFHPDGIERGDAGEPTIIAKVIEARQAAEQRMHRVRDRGIRIAFGTDSMHGYIGCEAEWAVAHGWTPAEAMLALTRNGGLLVGDPTAGVLEPGSRADFVVVPRDPLQHISAVREVREVYRAGRRVVGRDGKISALDTRGER